jgi:hypothetical protein
MAAAENEPLEPIRVTPAMTQQSPLVRLCSEGWSDGGQSTKRILSADRWQGLDVA